MRSEFRSLFVVFTTPFIALCAAMALMLVPTGDLARRAHAALPSEARWLTDVREAMDGSHTYIDRRVRRGGRNLAVNFDIDNTTIARHYNPGHAVARVLSFAKHARSKGVRQVFNTARLYGDGYINRTKRQLNALGYHVTRICGRYPGESVVHSKQRCRRRFVDQGYTLIANVGNRSTDFVGGNYERAFRLPNYGNQLS